MGGCDLVRYDAETGERELLVAAGQRVPEGEAGPLAIVDYAFSPDPAVS